MSNKRLWLDAYLVKCIVIRIPGTKSYKKVEPLIGIKVDPVNLVGRIKHYEVALRKEDFAIIN